jgi:tetratricopeptide (TPR) repeat protein
MKWTAFPYPRDYGYDATSLRRQWTRLHTGDCEPLPEDADVLQAWVCFHQGDFHQARQTGLQVGGAGLTVAHKATCMYATHLEPKERHRLDLFLEVAERAGAHTLQEPDNANAWYLQAYALGHYSQGISVAKALAQGLGARVKSALEHAIALQPRHADAHLALGSFHAEVIDKVGSLIGGLTYGARKDIGLQMYRQALRLHPGSAHAMVEYANGLLMLEGDSRMKEATSLYEKAAACQALDALERMNVERAKAELSA